MRNPSPKQFSPRRRPGAVPGGALLMCALALAGCRQQPPPPEVVETPRNVRILELTSTNLQEYFEIAGPIAPVRGTDVHAQETGTVARIVRDKGQPVAAGEILIELDRSLLAAELESARANLELQRYNAEKMQQLFDAGKISRIELLGAAAEHARAQSLFDIAALRHDRAAVKAPYAGLVVDRFVELGELVAPGQRVARVIDPYTLKLVGYLTEREVAWVSIGSEAEVRLEGSERIAAGRLEWVAFEAEQLSGKFRVEIHVDNADLLYHSGMIGRARLQKHEFSDAITIPRDAVVTTGAGPAVFVVDEENRAHAQPVRLGSDQGLMVTVREGLVVGDRIVVRGQRDLVDGNLVKVTEVADTTDGSLAADPEVVKAASAGSRVGAPDREAER